MKRMLKIVVSVIMFVVAFVLCGIRIYAGGYPEQLNNLDFSEISGVIDKTSGMPQGMTFAEAAAKAVSGELGLSLKDIVFRLLETLFSEAASFLALTRDMLVIALLGAVFKALSDNLRSKSVSDLGFYVTYMIAVTILLDTFSSAAGIMLESVSNLCRLVEAAVPLMSGLLLMSGNPAMASVFNPLAVLAAGAAEFIIRDVAAPALIFAAVLEIVNNLSEKEMLGRMAALIKKGLTAGLVSLAGLFIGVLTLQRISVPVADNAAAKAAKYAVNAVPVVGQALTGAVDAVVYWSGALRSGVMAAAIIAVLFMCLPAVLKLAAFTAVYKLTAALMQPVCDKRIVNAVGAVGSLTAAALGAAALAAVAFIFLMIIVISV